MKSILIAERVRRKENRLTDWIHPRIAGTVRTQVDAQVWFPMFDKQEAQDWRIHNAYTYLFDDLQYGLECP